MDVKYWPPQDGLVILSFIQDQPLDAQRKIINAIRRLREHGYNLMNSSYLTKLKGYPLYELRVKFGRILYRIILAIKKGIAWLLVPFTKKEGEETPVRHIETALKRSKLI